MQILIAEDDPVSSRLLERTLQKWGHQVIVAGNGVEALDLARQHEARFIIADWMMPQMDGAELCRRLRQEDAGKYVYIIMLTAKGTQEDITEGLQAGADDYVVKPPDPPELRARIAVGLRVIELEDSLSAHITELQDALAHVKRLQGLLPMCSHCKRVRDDKDYWHRVDVYIAEHTDADITHSICPSYMRKYYGHLFRDGELDEKP